MAQLSHAQYEQLERAVTHRRRISVYRRGTEYIVIPLALRMERGRELVTARHPTTGEQLSIYVDEMDAFEVIG